MSAPGRYGGPERRRSSRHEKRFQAVLEYEDIAHEIRTINISLHGVLIPRRTPPPVGTPVRLTLIIRGERAVFDGTVARHTKCLVNGVLTTGMGIDISSEEYQQFVKDKIVIV
jgi:hypothetical protein